MKAKVWGIFSALTASVCCLGPLVLIGLGLGSLGFGAVLGRYHWYFILGAALLLSFAWRTYLKEKRSCESAHCEMEGRKLTRNVLLAASVVVLTFAGLNFYTVAQGSSALCFTAEDAPGQLGQAAIRGSIRQARAIRSGLPGVSGAVPARGFRPRAGGGEAPVGRAADGRLVIRHRAVGSAKRSRPLTRTGAQVTIPVKGMSCFTCEVAVQTAVKKLPGVTEVKASAKHRIVRISYDSEKTSLEEIVQAIRKTGYQADVPKL